MSIVKFLEINTINDNKNLMFLPFDLFKFNISFEWDEVIVLFIRLVNEVKEKKGRYFKEHFMSVRLQLNDIIITSNQAKLLYPHIDDFKLIRTWI